MLTNSWLFVFESYRDGVSFWFYGAVFDYSRIMFVVCGVVLLRLVRLRLHLLCCNLFSVKDFTIG